MPVDRSGLIFRSNYFGDAAAWQAVADLLEETFGIDVTGLDRLGGPDPTCTAFAWFDDAGACIANISAFALPLVIDGVVVQAAGLQSGAVRPSHRGRGLYRDVMQAALDHCDAKGFAAVLLLTETPDLYTRHGFRTLPQHGFSGPAPEGGRARSVRRLHIESDDDVALLCRLLDARSPVSNRFAPLRQREMFLFNALLAPDVNLDFLEEDDAVVAWRSGEDGCLELLDIVATSIPSLADILASLEISTTRVIVRFAPDRLAWEGTALPDAGDMKLMLRGAESLLPAGPFALPSMAEF